MPSSIRLGELDTLTSAERADVLRKLVADASQPPNGHLAAARARVRDFERRYELSSEALIERLRTEEMRETAEIAEWLYFLRLTEIGSR